MSFVATGSSTAPAGAPIKNNGFWPDIDPGHFRDAQRIDSTITAPRVENALLAAVIDANNQLREWQQKQMDAGYQSIDDVPGPSHLPPSAQKTLYLRAVYAFAKANIVERYRDYDSTGAGLDRGEEMDTTIDDYRRDAAWAIADIVGRTRTTVELI